MFVRRGRKENFSRERSSLIYSSLILNRDSIRVRLGEKYLHIYYREGDMIFRHYMDIREGRQSLRTRRVAKGFGWGSLTYSCEVILEVSQSVVIVTVNLLEYVSTEELEPHKKEGLVKKELLWEGNNG